MNSSHDKPRPDTRSDGSSAVSDEADLRLDRLLASRPVQASAGFAAAVRARIAEEDRLPVGVDTDAAEPVDFMLERFLRASSVEVSPTFTDRVMARTTRRGSFAGAWRAIGALAAVLALSAGVILQRAGETIPQVAEGVPVPGVEVAAVASPASPAVAATAIEASTVELLVLEDDLDALAALLDSETLEVLALLSEG